MIVELANTISFQDISSGWMIYQMTLFPAPAMKGQSNQSLRKRKGLGTDVFHGSIEENLGRMRSIPRRHYLLQTTLPFRCVVIGRQYCGSSMDQVERANFGYLAVTCHLPENLSDSHQQ